MESDSPSVEAGSANTALKVRRDEPGGVETRERILDAAQSLFAAHGFSATTVKAIAKRAEVPGGLIFYYFPTKKALLEQVFRERGVLAGLSTVVETQVVSADPRAALLLLGERYLTLLKEHEEVAAIQLREFRSHPEIAAQFRTLREEHVHLISAYIRRVLRAHGINPAQSLEARARMFLYSILEITVIDTLTEPLNFVEEMVDILLCNLCE